MDLYRARVVEPLYVLSRSERERRLAAADYNLYLLDGDAVTIDMLTDSGLCALSAEQQGAMLVGDETYAGSSSFNRFRDAVRDLFGYEFVIPAHQGRAAERLMLQCLAGPGKVIVGNCHFDTTRGNMLNFGVEPMDFPSQTFWQFNEPLPFKGNVDLDSMASYLNVDSSRVSLMLMTITNNLCGDQPVSMENVRAARELANQHGIPLYFDACRVVQNAWFVQQWEKGFASRSISSIVREMCSLSDGCTFSAKKDGLAHMGGFFATNDPAVAEHAKELVLLQEGFVTYGGMTGRDMEVIVAGFREVVTESFLRERTAAPKYLFDCLAQAGVPVLQPAGGHAVYLDAEKILPDMPLAGQSLAVAIYLDSGVRSTRVALRRMQAGFEHSVELLRLALPARVYTRTQLQYVAESVTRVAGMAAQIPALEITRAPAHLSGFLAHYKIRVTNNTPHDGFFRPQEHVAAL